MEHKEEIWSQKVKVGLSILGIILLIFGIWLFFIPLESAAIAKGRLVVSKHRKSIQHEFGGTIQEIYVEEGSKVKKGDPLIKLDDTQEKLQLNVYTYASDQLRANKARLMAQLSRASTIDFPESVTKEVTRFPKIREILKLQKQTFAIQKKALEDQIRVYDKKIEKLNSVIEYAQNRLLHAEKQLTLYQQEEKEVEDLRKQNLVSLPRLLNLQREREKVEENIQTIKGSIEEANKEILENQAQKTSAVSTYLNKLTDELKETESKLLESEEKLASGQKKIRDSLIVAPIDGIVIDLKFHTLGGVIKPGELIMELVPVEDKLLIEANVDPVNVDILKPGAIAHVDFLPFGSRRYPLFEGKVIQVSADIFQEEKTSAFFYKVYIEIPTSNFQKYPELNLYPGMPVMVYIIQEKRTLWNYIISPIIRSYQQAFREKG